MRELAGRKAREAPAMLKDLAKQAYVEGRADATEVLLWQCVRRAEADVQEASAVWPTPATREMRAR